MHDHELQSIAARLRDGLSTARLHGALAGALCADADFSRRDAGLLGPALELAPDDAATLIELRDAASRVEESLRDPEFGFVPLLPHDDESLGQRAHALAEWCDAFIAGFSVCARARRSSTLSAESEEILTDIGAIAGGLDAGALDAGEEEDEKDFAQIAEFVRIATISIFVEHVIGRDEAVLH